MAGGGFLHLFLKLLLLCPTEGLLSTGHRRLTEGDRTQSKAILEMLHIDKISAIVQGKPHPYMRNLYQRLGSLQGPDLEGADGTLVQSVRSSKAGPGGAPAGWIWFNITAALPSALAAELVLFRKTIHPHPVNVTVTLHSLALSRDGSLHPHSPALEERLLSLDRRHPSGYDVFHVSAALTPVEVIGFQLRYKDESGSLVLHDALTRSLYCMERGSLREPILVLYKTVLLN